MPLSQPVAVEIPAYMKGKGIEKRILRDALVITQLEKYIDEKKEALVSLRAKQMIKEVK